MDESDEPVTEADRLAANKIAVEVFFHGMRKKRRVLPGQERLNRAVRERVAREALQKPDAGPDQEPSEDEDARKP